jgi:putative ABC transport system permease protein
MPIRFRMPLALRILINSPGRLVISAAGILLAIVLMFSQAGFRNGMFDSQAELIRRLNGELFLVGRLKVLLFVAEPFPSRRLYQARACPGVQAVYALYTEGDRAIWKGPKDGRTRPIRLLAFDPFEPVINIPEVAAHAEALRQPDTVLFDEWSRDYYGRPREGTRGELSGHRVVVVGTFRLGTDFLTDGTVIMSDRNYWKMFARKTSLAPHLDEVSIGVIRLEPGADPRSVQRELRQTLPEDVLVLSKKELVDNVSNYLPQFATLKAMGFTDRFLVGVVLQQGIFLALIAFLPAVGVVQVLFWIVAHLTGLLLYLTPLRLLFILVVAVVMCTISGMIAVRRVLATDPAEVFR